MADPTTTAQPAPTTSSTTSSQLYGRSFSLIVSNSSLNGIDLSALRCKFVIKRSDTMTPNVADIRVYNLAADTASRIQKEFTQVILQAGYQSQFGVIFKGNIKQVIIGRESATDTFIDIIAGDGDRGYNFAIVSTTLGPGATAKDQITAASIPMAANGVTTGANNAVIPPTALPRGKVMYGSARNYLRKVAQNSDSNWSIQNEQITFISKKSYLPNQAVIMNSGTGMIGTPQQTTIGVNVKSLLNPNLRIGNLIQINQAQIEAFKINLTVPNSASNIPAPFNVDGVYYAFVIEHNGDTRGVEWYTSVQCLNVSVTSNPANAIQTNYE